MTIMTLEGGHYLVRLPTPHRRFFFWPLHSLPAASALALSVHIGFGGGFSIGFVLLRWLCLPVAAVAIMTVCVDFQGLRCNNCVSILSS